MRKGKKMAKKTEPRQERRDSVLKLAFSCKEGETKISRSLRAGAIH